MNMMTASVIAAAVLLLVNAFVISHLWKMLNAACWANAIVLESMQKHLTPDLVDKVMVGAGFKRVKEGEDETGRD